MQTEFPRGEIVTQMGAVAASSPKGSTKAGALAEFDDAELSGEDLELIDLRYNQFVAQSALDHLMDEL